jgi:tetratricopeptide (TPR) repeat protein
MIQSRFFSIGLWVSLITLATLSGATPLLLDNHWSIDFLGKRLNSNSENLKIDPPEHHQRAKFWLAEQVLEEGDVEGALFYLQQSSGKETYFNYHTIGKINSKREDFEAAIQTWSQIKDYQSLDTLARQSEAKNDFKTALNAYQSAAKANLKLGALPFANFLSNTLGDYNSAKKILFQALQTYSVTHSRNLWLLKLGDILQQEESWEEARLLYQKILAENPSDYNSYIELGWIYYEMGYGFETAKGEFEKAIKLDPHDGLGYFAMGQIFAEEGRYSEADKWFELATKYNPKKKIWHLIWANSTRSNGDLKQALKLYHELTSQYPDWAPAYFELARTYQLTGEKQKAINMIEKAILLMHPPNNSYFWRAGQIYEWAGRDKKALAAYHHILLTEPKNDNAIKAIQRIETKDQ